MFGNCGFARITEISDFTRADPFKNGKDHIMSWIYLFVAIIFEVGWAVGLKFSDSLSLSKPVPTSITVFSMVASVVFLALAVKEIPIGTAYAIWTGSGAVCVAVFGMIFFNEPVFALRIIFLFLIISGVVGLKIVS